MSIRVEKCFFDLNQAMDSAGILTTLEVPYLVFEVEDESTALIAVREAAPSTYQNLKLNTIEIDERINKDTFKVRALYEINVFGDGSSQDDPEPSFAFDTGGGSRHISQSLKTVGKYPATAPDFGGAIEVDNEGSVNGVDISMPMMNFSETHYFRPSKVSTRYKQRLAELTGKVNSKNFRGYNPGEVLFLGVSGTRRGKHAGDHWEISFRFAVSPNRESLQVGSLTVKEKFGWDYLWVRYADDISSDQKSLIKKPVAAYVERVYEFADFGGLGIKN